MIKDVPLWERYALTVDQAAAHFGIGTKKIRKMISVYKDSK